MPTTNELETLYQKGKGTRNMTPLLKTTGWWVWSGEEKDSSAAWSFTFKSRGTRTGAAAIYSHGNRAFAVRSPSDE